MLQICQPKKYSLTPNKLFLPQQDSTEPAFSETGYTDQNDEARLNSTKTKNQYEASAEAKPSADRECNNFTKEKSSSTTAEEDDLSNEEPAMGQFNGHTLKNV
mmetsp:Transcript_14483/g.30472  ORF Transcript_14483/g.30472 Transcript_14483/m.30472 type:complete len:103 (-) Transcript_14483:12-320(-)